ncbi:MAG: SMC family ATPase, partial [Ilumatobacteraceae bacterium]
AGAAAAAVAAVTDRAGAAADAVAAARSARDDLKDRAGAAAFAGLLTVGAPCPLCLHDVVHLPEHHVSDDLAAAAGRLADAERDLRVVSTELAEVTERAAACRADVASRERELAAIDADLDGVPDDDSLTLLLAAAVARRDAVVSAAAADASAAARLADHDTDPVHVEALAAAACAAAAVTAATAVHETTRHRAELLDAEVAGLPPVGELERSIAEADRLAEGQRRAAASQATAEQARDAAVGTRDEVAAQVRHATSALVAARDRLAPLGPPPADPTRGLAAGWSSLAAWAHDAGSILERTRREVVAEREELARRREDIDAAARERCAAVLGWATGDLAGLRDALVRAEEIAGGAVARFDADRERLAILRDRIEHLLTDAAVATELGNRLRVNGFEAWLMRAALEDLVDDATVRLRELSSGQFSLELVDDEFVVRDHANADEVRSARTLSGGETFLASLSLALALADATNELSTATHERSAPAMESIFLDEGFGTLDPGTLDVVAAAIEELGSRGRMVALVTHIRDLADRMPVRLEVTKTGATSRVERVDT